MTRISALVVICMLAAVSAVRADPAVKLSSSGTIFPAIVVDWSDAELTRIVDSGGDQILATHIVARVHSTSQAMQRTNLGYWVPWDGDIDSLVDNQMPRAGGQITFKILDQSLEGLSAPLTVTLMYRTPAGMKIGQFQVEARR